MRWTVAVFVVQIWFIGRTPASQAGKAGSIPVICSQKLLQASNLSFSLYYEKVYQFINKEYKN